MQAVILAAGRGTRLQPLTDSIPKAMVLVNGRPMLEILLRQLASVGIRDIVLVVHYRKEKIMDYFKDGSHLGLSLTYIDQREMKGSAHALQQAASFVKSDKFICIACDSLFETSLLQQILAHPSVGVITCTEVEDGRRFGILVIEEKKVTRLIEKPENPPTNLANCSVYLFPSAIFTACAQVQPGLKGEYLLTDAIQKLIDAGVDFGYVKSKHILDIGTHEQLQEAQGLAKKLRL